MSYTLILDPHQWSAVHEALRISVGELHRACRSVRLGKGPLRTFVDEADLQHVSVAIFATGIRPSDQTTWRFVRVYESRFRDQIRDLAQHWKGTDMETTTVLTGTYAKVAKGTQIILPNLAWDGVLSQLVTWDEKKLRDKIARGLSGVARSANPKTDKNGTLAYTLANEDEATIVLDATTEVGIEMSEIEMETKVAEKATSKRTRSRPKKEGVVIPEGYGDQERGTWYPGFDAKFKSALIQKIDSEADTDAAAEMVSRGWWTQEKATDRLDRATAKLEAAAATSDDE